MQTKGFDPKELLTIFSKITEGFAYCRIITDRKGQPIDWVYLEVNDAYERINEVKRAEVVGKKATEVLPTIRNDPAGWISLYGKVALTGESVTVERYAEVRNKWYHISAYSPQKGYFVSIFDDITERKKTEASLRQSEERFSKAFNESPAAVIITRLSDGRYVDVNGAFEIIFGYTRAEVIGRTSTEIDIFAGQGGREEFLRLFGREGRIRNQEMTFRAKDGKLVPTILSVEKLMLNGEEHILTTLIDITERKKAEEELKKLNDELEERVDQRTEQIGKERQRLYKVLEALPAYVVLLDKTYHVAFANKVFRELFGESKGRPCYEFLFNCEAPCENCETYKVLKTNRPHHWEWTGPNGREYDINDFPFIAEDGSTQILEMGLDVTDSKHAERELKKYQEHLEQLVAERTEALRESEQRWVTTLSSIGDAVIATDTEEKITFMNPVAEELTGWPLSEAKQKSIKQVFNIINEQTRKAVESPVTRVLKEGLIVGLANHTVLVRKDGTEIPIDDSGAPIVSADGGAISGVVLVFRDISERKKTEERLQRQAALIDLSPDAIIVRKLDGTITFWSKGAEKLYGWTAKEAIGKATHELFQTRFYEPFDVITQQLRSKKQWSGELVHKTKTGREVTVQSWWLAEKTEHSEIKSILESNVDITERKKAEKEITRLATFPMLNPSPVIEIDFEGKLTFTNPATEDFFPDLQNAGLNHEFFSNWQSALKTFEDKNTNTFGREIKIGEHWYHQQFYLVQQTQQIRIYTTDIDELKKSEESRARAQVKLEENAVLLEEYASQMEELAEQRAQQLQNAERMAAIGQTAGMVGHDIRNPLQAITSDMYLIAEEVKTIQDNDNKQAILESIESVNQNIGYINKIVSDLQDYTRPLKPNLQAANLAELIEGTLLTINIPKSIDVTTEIAENAKPIKTDVAYLRRILTNLLTNGVQAMSDEGKLTVKASKEANAVSITVQDTGVGIPEEAKEKMFTPLFTTKSKGQGLGLAVVKRLVETLGGRIGFVSEENNGTTFTVELPQN